MTMRQHMERDIESLRPLYLIVTFWGERFRNYFVDYCLPTLLAPGNIPSLIKGRKNKFLICTTTEDWQALQELPIIHLLKSYITPVFIEILPAPPGRSGCEHMGVGHKLATNICYRDRVFGAILTPDMLLSDGALAAVQAHALAGKQLVLCPASLRIEEESLFAGLERMNILASGEKLSRGERTLALTGRQMVSLALSSLHSTAHLYDWDAAHFADFPVACYWRIPGETGIVMHCLSWTPMLLDYSATRDHSTRVLETWSIDADYVYSNFSEANRVHLVTDSDEMIVLSWSPSWDRRIQLRRDYFKGLRVFGDFFKLGCLHQAYFSPIYDDMKRDFFFAPVYWHADDLDKNWDPVVRRARSLIRTATSDYDIGRWGKAARVAAPPMGYLKKFYHLPILLVAWLTRVKFTLYLGYRAVRLLFLASLGDSAAQSRLRFRFRTVFDQLRRRIGPERVE